MKLAKIFLTILAVAGFTAVANADLSYTFNTDVEGFTGVQWWADYPTLWADKPSIQTTFTGTGWQQQQIKEFSYGPGGGSAEQQGEMQRLANTGFARISFDVMADEFTDPTPSNPWDQTYIIGNSDGAKGWSQNTVATPGWQPGMNGFWSGHFDLSFDQMGWQPGDTWFQMVWVMNGGDPINYYFDNFKLYEVPEPGMFALAGLGAAALLIFRRK